MRPFRHRLARIAAVAALLVTLALVFASPVMAWDGDTLTLPDSVDDGGVTLPVD